jgi:hypothetical protein
MALVASLALAAAPIHVPTASAQTPMPVQVKTGGGASSYVLPVVIGVVIGAIAVPMLVTAVTDMTMMGAAPAAAPAGAAAAAAPAAGWTWHTVLTMPEVIGGVVGGIAGYSFSR